MEPPMTVTLPRSVPPRGTFSRRRRDDIPLLVQHFLARFARPGVALHFSPEALDHLLQYDWPGNVRELRNHASRTRDNRAPWRCGPARSWAICLASGDTPRRGEPRPRGAKARSRSGSDGRKEPRPTGGPGEGRCATGTDPLRPGVPADSRRIDHDQGSLR